LEFRENLLSLRPPGFCGVALEDVIETGPDTVCFFPLRIYVHFHKEEECCMILVQGSSVPIPISKLWKSFQSYGCLHGCCAGSKHYISESIWHRVDH
jgi:hypothetical protein